MPILRISFIAEVIPTCTGDLWKFRSYWVTQNRKTKLANVNRGLRWGSKTYGFCGSLQEQSGFLPGLISINVAVNFKRVNVKRYKSIRAKNKSRLVLVCAASALSYFTVCEILANAYLCCQLHFRPIKFEITAEPVVNWNLDSDDLRNPFRKTNLIKAHESICIMQIGSKYGLCDFLQSIDLIGWLLCAKFTNQPCTCCLLFTVLKRQEILHCPVNRSHVVSLLSRRFLRGNVSRFSGSDIMQTRFIIFSRVLSISNG